MKKVSVVFLVLAIFGYIGWKVYLSYTEDTSEMRRRRERPRVAVEVAPVKRENIQDIGYFTGSLKPNSLILIAPKISGRLKRMNVNIGDQLTPGQLIAVLDNDEFKHQLQQAKANLDVARANLDAAEEQMNSAKRELERILTLQQKNLVSTAEVDNAKTDFSSSNSSYRVAKAQLEEKLAAYEISRIRLSYTKIVNDWGDGETNLVVGERFVDEGALIGSTIPVISVLDISSMVGVIHVTEVDYYKIRTGQKAEILVDALPGMRFSGTVVRIAPIIKEKSREAQIELEIPNADGILKPGLFIRASIRFTVHRDATVIPINALVKRHENEGVFLLDAANESVTFLNVKTGFIEKERVEIISPHLEGFVVTQGHHLLENGSQVTIPGKKKITKRNSAGKALDNKV